MTKQSSRSAERRSLPEWEKIMEDQAESGITQSAYCQKHGITMSGFYHARKRLAKVTRKKDDTGELQAREFIPVELPLMPESSGGVEATLNLGKGIILSIRRQC